MSESKKEKERKGKQFKVTLPNKIKGREKKLLNGVEQEVEIELDNPFEGYVELLMLKYQERIELVKELQFKLVDGKLEKKDADELAVDLIESAEKFCKSVDVKHKLTGHLFKSFDEASYYEEGSELINQIGEIIMTGIKLSPESVKP